MLNNILEVCEGLAAFIHGRVTGRVRVVDDVDVVPPTVVVFISIQFRLLLLLQEKYNALCKVGADPVCILRGQFGHHDNSVIGDDDGR